MQKKFLRTLAIAMLLTADLPPAHAMDDEWMTADEHARKHGYNKNHPLKGGCTNKDWADMLGADEDACGEPDRCCCTSPAPGDGQGEGNENPAVGWCLGQFCQALCAS